MSKKEFDLLQHKSILKVKKVLLKYKFTFNLYFSYFFFMLCALILILKPAAHYSCRDISSNFCTDKVYTTYGRTWTAQGKFFAKSQQYFPKPVGNAHFSFKVKSAIIIFHTLWHHIGIRLKHIRRENREIILVFSLHWRVKMKIISLLFREWCLRICG